MMLDPMHAPSDLRWQDAAGTRQFLPDTGEPHKRA
jgi:hypothetical protein